MPTTSGVQMHKINNIKKKDRIQDYGSRRSNISMYKER